MINVLFIDTVHPILQEMLSAKGFNCVDGTAMSEEEILNDIYNYHGIVIRSRIKIDKNFLRAAKKLIFIARSGAGMENIDLLEAENNGVICFNSPEGNRDAVAEHALGMLLSLFNHLKRGDQEVREGVWNREKNRGIELCGKTVGIIGYGNMGKAFAQRLKGFGATVITYDKYKRDYSDEFAQEVELETLYREADVVSLHIPLTEETHYYADAAFFKKFRKPIYIINTARGKVLSVRNLLEAMDSGNVLGACLDVLEFESTSFEEFQAQENTDFAQLASHDRIILSPHVAGWTVESYRKLSEYLGRKILAFFEAEGN